MDIWSYINCDNCQRILHEPTGFVKDKRIFDYFIHYKCSHCNGRGVCKICKKQINIGDSADDRFSMEIHIMTHYGIDEFDIIRNSKLTYKYIFDSVNNYAPYLFLLSRYESIYDMILHVSEDTTKIDDFVQKVMSKLLSLDHVCVICLDDYGAFPTIEIIISHLKQKHGLIDPQEVNVCNSINCPHNTFKYKPCRIDSNITTCDGTFHITKVGKLPPIKWLLSAP